jgi:multidrug efflux pump subunit AcrB
VSLLTALILIPSLARFLILRKDNIGPKAKVPVSVRLQESFAHNVLVKPLHWANHTRKRLWVLGITALIVGFGFIFAGGYIFKYVTFNIFPPNKDSDYLGIQVTFPAGTDINKAQEIADKADKITAQTLGSNLKQINYYATANEHDAQMAIDLTPYTDREATAPQLVDKLKANFKNFEANVTVNEQGPGGPPGDFNVLIETPNRANAQALAKNMADFMRGRELKRLDGSTARITQAIVASPDSYQRKDNKQLVEVSVKFDADDTSTLVDLAKKTVNEEYTNKKLAKYHLNTSNIVFDLGFEEDNQQSFNSMLIAFPILLVVMYILLALEFRSMLQPLLIFMAIPFSFFGITAGLYLTDNPFSFFTMLGFFALIGLSIKNTILLTDYANQGRRIGLGRVDAIAFAVEERFRPLLATSATAVIALLPLALTSPFWESLAFTLIFGLISSTTLVLLVFPYYYLGAEYLRMRVSRSGFFKWLALNVLVVGLIGGLSKTPGLGFLAFLVLNIILIVLKKFRNKK